jgi:YegS/Rv2252/BmrU family lipid kinase
MHHIIVNPIAGKGRSMAVLPKLTQFFKANGIPFEWVQTNAPMDAYTQAQAICQQGSDGIIGVGGDGTIQEIVAGMAAVFKDTIPIPLGIMACGSGNDFMFSVMGEKRANIRQIEKNIKSLSNGILNKETRRVDLIKAGDRAYINIANIGLDARIVKNAINYKKRFGGYAYYAAVYKSIAEHKNLKLSVEVNGELIEDTFTLIAVCNGQYYGGGMRIAPPAKIDDGKITLCLINGMSRLKAMALFPSILLEKHTSLSVVRFIHCSTCTLHWQGEETLCMDGNLYPLKGPVVFEIKPGALNLFKNVE